RENARTRTEGVEPSAHGTQIHCGTLPQAPDGPIVVRSVSLRWRMVQRLGATKAPISALRKLHFRYLYKQTSPAACIRRHAGRSDLMKSPRSSIRGRGRGLSLEEIDNSICSFVTSCCLLGGDNRHKWSVSDGLGHSVEVSQAKVTGPSAHK